MRSISVSPSRDQPGDHQAGRGAQVGRHHRRALQPFDALAPRRYCLDLDARAQRAQLRHVHEAVLEDGLRDHAVPSATASDRHELRLHVGREARDRLRATFTACGRRHLDDGHRVGGPLDGAPASPSLSQRRVEVRRHDAFAAGRGRRSRGGGREGAVSMRSGMTWCRSAPRASSRPRCVTVAFPRPRCARPSPPGTSPRSTTSGSRAAFSSTVVPSASTAAIIRFSVPVDGDQVHPDARALQLRCARRCSRARCRSSRPSPAGP